MAIVNLKDVKVGSKLSKEVFDFNTGRIILSKGTQLSERHMEQLSLMGVHFVEVESGERENRNETEITIEDVMNLEERVVYYTNKLVEDLNELYEMVKNGKKLILNNISKTLDCVLENILVNDDIMEKIRIIDLDDIDYTLKHSIHVCFYSAMIGKWLKYDNIRIKQLSLSALLHDIGKAKVPEYILNKPEKLTEKEYEIVKKHVIYGYNILKETVGISQAVAYGALQHHERENGSGYPLGITSDQIHQYAKIIAVCDIYDAMTSQRVFKSKKSLFLVADMIHRDSFGTLDPKISLLFLKNLSKFYVGNAIRLNDGREGIIVYINRNEPTKPVVKVEEEYIDLSTNKKFSIEEIL